MARLKLGAIITEASGKLGGQTVSKVGNTVYIKNNTVSKRTGTRSQMQRRLTTQYLMSMYSYLSDFQKQLWHEQTPDYEFKDKFGDTQRRNAFQLFQLINQYRLLTGGGLITNPFPVHKPSFPVGINATVSETQILLQSDAYANDDVIMIYATPPIPNGVSATEKYMRFIGYVYGYTIAGGIGFIDEYLKVFPSLKENTYIQFGVKTVSNNSGYSNGILIINPEKTLVFNPAPPPYDVDAQLYIDAVGGLNQTQKNNITNHVIGLKSNGIWSKLKAIYPFMGTTGTQHRYNLKNPVSSDAAFRLVYFGTVYHGSQFIEGDGSTGYVNTFYNPLSQASLNSESITIQTRNAVASGVNTRVEIGATTSVGQTTKASFLQVDTPEPYGVMNTDLGTTSGLNGPVYTDKRGVFTLKKNGSTTLHMYKNGVQIASMVQAGTRPNNSLYLLNINVANTPFPSGYSAQKLGYVAIGAGLDAVETLALSDLITALNPL